MYTNPIVALPVVVTTGAAVATLPNTGGNILVSAALSVGAGMLTWGIVYARNLKG
jgi:tellurite resistance protein TehA-like permease